MIEPPRAYKTEKVNPDYERKELSDLSEGKNFSDRSDKKGKNKEIESRQQIIWTENSMTSPSEEKSSNVIEGRTVISSRAKKLRNFFFLNF